MKGKKKIISVVLFLALAAFTFYAVFHGQDLAEIGNAIRNIHKGYLAAAALVALFFVAAEGIMIWYLFRVVGEKAPLLSCLKYSYTGFFYSGITPSATGGQPMQLYYMTKDGRKTGISSVILMAVAAAYKFVLVIIGIGIAVFWFGGLRAYLGGYLYLFFLGLFLNAVLVVVIVAMMLNGPGMERFIMAVERFLVRIHLLKPSAKRLDSIHGMVEQYKETVAFLRGHKKQLLLMVGFTFVQRFSVFFLTYLIYAGLGLSGNSMLVIMMLQAVIYISVDMLPLPGSQGITELMYVSVYTSIFTEKYLTVSMCVTRGLNFYLLLIVSAMVALYCWLRSRPKTPAAKTVPKMKLEKAVEQ